MQHNRLYHDLAWLWPFVSRPEEYASEAAYWRAVLREKLGFGTYALLELGAGGGHLLAHLATDFAVTAADAAPAMLRQARTLIPGLRCLAGDMRTLRLDHAFDAVIIHDAILYMTTAADLHAAFATAAAQLRPGGVLLTSVEQYQETFRDNVVEHATRSDGATTVTYVEYRCQPDAGAAVESRMVYFVRRGAALEVYHDRHVTGLFPFQTWVDAMAAAGFDVERYPYVTHQDGREIPMLVGTRVEDA
ncbi:MAG: class I SAM-dependent methyltransferase [Candidatus Hydrogenedentota bacterium]